MNIKSKTCSSLYGEGRSRELNPNTSTYPNRCWIYQKRYVNRGRALRTDECGENLERRNRKKVGLKKLMERLKGMGNPISERNREQHSVWQPTDLPQG